MTINLAPVRVVGIPGLTLAAIAIAINIEFPEVRWLVLSGLIGGAIFAVALIVERRQTRQGDDAGQRIFEALHRR